MRFGLVVIAFRLDVNRSVRTQPVIGSRMFIALQDSAH
jgi:hypothetical protein